MTNPITSPAQLCASFERTYPGVFSAIEQARLTARANGTSWPAWCYAPIAASQAVMDRYGVIGAPNLVTESAKAAAMAAWRSGGKNALLFDEAVLAELWQTTVSGDIPTEALLRFPFWGAYIPLPVIATKNKLIAGVFVHLEHDANTSKPELRFLLHLSSGNLMMLPLDVDARVPLPDAIKRTFSSGLNNTPLEQQAGANPYLNVVRMLIEPLVSLTLYLCADNAEIRDPVKHAPFVPSFPNPARKIYAQPSPTEWNVAWRIGAALKRAGESVAAAEKREPGNGTKRPHMRAAHWHTYLAGVGRSKRILHWLPPTPVNMPDDVDADAWADLLPVTVRPVKEK